MADLSLFFWVGFWKVGLSRDSLTDARAVPDPGTLRILPLMLQMEEVKIQLKGMFLSPRPPRVLGEQMEDRENMLDSFLTRKTLEAQSRSFLDTGAIKTAIKHPAGKVPVVLVTLISMC